MKHFYIFGTWLKLIAKCYLLVFGRLFWCYKHCAIKHVSYRKEVWRLFPLFRLHSCLNGKYLLIKNRYRYLSLQLLIYNGVCNY